MSYEIHADHGQVFLLPPAVEDWIPPGHPARFVRDFVAQLDLDKLGFRRRRSEEGRPSYSNELLLTAWMYGYFEGIRSSRRLERAASTHLPLIWLLGMHSPDHNSLWRFWRAHHEALRGVFRQSVLVAREMGLAAMVVHAVDGTKIPVQATRAGAMHRVELEKLNEAITETITAIEAAIAAEGEQETPSSELPAALQEATARQTAIREALATLEEQGTAHHLPAEPDARMMMQPNGRTGWCYNAQAAVDAAHGVVVAEEVTQAATDYGQLSPMLEQIAQTLGATAEFVLADAGYRSAPQEQAAQAHSSTVLLPEHGRDTNRDNPYDKRHFHYDAAADQYTCPQGQPLGYTHTIAAHGNRAAARVYRCRACKLCPMRAQCTTARHGRTIRRDEHEAFREEQQAQRQGPFQRALMRLRPPIIETLFGHIKENMGFRRWSARGLENAQAQWTMLCLTVNLKKLHAHWKAENERKRTKNAYPGVKALPCAA